MSGKRETYTHRPMSISDAEMAERWERTFGVPCVHEAQGSDQAGQGQADGDAGEG